MPTNNLLESLFKTGDGMFAVDQEQRIVFWNQGAEAVLGYTEEEAMGKRCFEVLQGVEESGRATCVQNCPIVMCARQGKLSCGQNLLVKAKNGPLHWLSLTHIFMTSTHNHLSIVVHVFRDVTPEMEAKRLLQQMTALLSSYGSWQNREESLPNLDAPLTRREQQVLALLAQGDGTNPIADKLQISTTTARNHIQNIITKLGVHTRLEAAAYATRYNLVDPGSTMHNHITQREVSGPSTTSL
jgi:PAS domain S-box-containing protein